jgi:osmoprotectant transport system substrate-binding protein
VGSAGFSENVTLARIYGGALEKAGYKVSYKLKIGAREVVEPALESGQIDLVPEYVGNYLNFLDPSVNGLPLDQATTKLKTAAQAKGLTVLNPSDAADGDVVAATKDYVAKNSLSAISDLKKLPGPVSFAGPAECQTRPTCLLGLQSVYGLQVKFVSTGTDSGGPVTKAALDKGDAVIGRLFSTDSDLGKKYTVLTDDKSFQLAGNIVPVVRSSKADDKLTQTLNKVSAALTTDKLTALDDQTDNQKQDPADVATKFLKDNNLG